MKKLIYFYCKDLRGFEDTEFNFSSKYKIHFDKDTEILTIDKGDKNYIDNFYGENIELNAIVGNNGAGKSTLLKRLYSDTEDFWIAASYIFVFEENTNDLIIRSVFKAREEISRIVMRNETLPIDILFPIPEHDREIVNVNALYLTQVLDQEMYYQNGSNYSMSGMIYNATKKCKNNKAAVITYFDDMFISQSDFLIYKDTQKITLLSIEDFVKGRMVQVYVKYGLYDLLDYVDKNEDVYIKLKNRKNLYKKFLLKIGAGLEGENYNFYERFFEGLISSFIYNVLAENNFDIDENKEPVSSILTISDDCRNINDIDEKLDYFFKRMESKTSIDVMPYQEFIKYIHETAFKWISENHGVYFNIPITQIKKFYEKYSIMEQKIPFLQFSWGLSSGETAMIDLYSKFYQIYKSATENNKKYPEYACKDILILIDEADAYFHPQWQRDYVKDTLDVAKQIFEGFNVQIILATHSPIMLSDIPKQNVLYLKKEENAGTKVVPREERLETFGANIFSLFKDTFFLEGSGIGSFAEERLTDFIAKIHNEENYKNNEKIREIERYIGMIGDSFIRKKFESEFEICKQKYMSLIERKNHLLKELAQIEQKIKEESQ